MNYTSLRKQFRSLLSTICALSLLFIIATQVVKAQAGPFLISPYYGAVGVNGGYSGAHPVYDYALSYTQVLAAAAGNIERAKWYDNRPECHGPTNNSDCGYGLHIYIQHSNGYITRYGHLSSAAFALNASGTAVQAGQVIGTSGNTGWSTGPHLHFEVKNQAGGNTDPNSQSLWKDGQWALPSRPIPAPVNGGEIVVNDTTNNSGGFSKGSGGPFSNTCTNNCGGWTVDSSMYYAAVNGSTANRWARWIPAGIPTGGAIYEVLVYVRNIHSTSWQAPFVVSHADGTASTVVDQEGLNEQWVSIGIYKMVPGNNVYVTDATGEPAGTRELGADAVKFVRRGTTYAPDVRYNNNGWTSAVTLRNNGGGLAKPLLKFLDANGGVLCSYNTNLDVHQSLPFGCSSSQVASAVLDAGQDVLMIIKYAATGKSNLDNGIATGSGDVAFERVATSLYVPAFYKGIYGDTNSSLYIQNTGSSSTYVTFDFKERVGSNNYLVGLSIPGGGRGVVGTSAIPVASWVGSVQIVSSSQPIAVKIEETASTSGSRSYSASSGGYTTLYVAAAYRNYLGLNTGLVIQNLNNTSANVTLLYCAYDVVNPATCPTQVFNGIAAYRAQGANLNAAPLTDGWRGSVKITSDVPVAVVVNNTKTSTDGYTFSAATYGGKYIYLPLAARSSTGSTTGYTVRNVNNGAVTVTAYYYKKSDGSLTWTRTFTLNTAQVAGFHQSLDALPDPWEGSILLVSTANIVAIMREDTSSTVGGYNGIVR